MVPTYPFSIEYSMLLPCQLFGFPTYLEWWLTEVLHLRRWDNKNTASSSVLQLCMQIRIGKCTPYSHEYTYASFRYSVNGKKIGGRRWNVLSEEREEQITAKLYCFMRQTLDVIGSARVWYKISINVIFSTIADVWFHCPVYHLMSGSGWEDLACKTGIYFTLCHTL